ncbi:MAG: UDP-N-acetylmuramoyl-tripeptide--D-alanyl-D-alanine ligase [Gammaproteobacteria bacterium]|nr:UDP-N-acetylmuramoyl-tripeptide--D-alanyl-D-alanine ligase [Gammaproteobacteria bacterium]
MLNLTVKELLSSLNFQDFEYLHNKIITDIKIDSRKISPNNIFIAIVGEQYDGHNYLTEAKQKGALLAIVERINNQIDLPQVCVSDTKLAMGEITKFLAKKWSSPKVCITGSNGKTTTKFILAAILQQNGKILCPQASFNNNIGVPLAMFSAEEEHWAGIFEMGTNHPGEIAYLTSLLQARVAILTTISSAHIGNFPNENAIAREKLNIFNNLSPDGTAIYNYDLDYKNLLLEKFASLDYLNNVKHLTFGLNPEADVWADKIILGPDKTNFRLNYQNHSENIEISLLGKHQVLNSLAAVAGALAFGVNMAEIKLGLELAQPVNKRMQAIKLDNKINIIDDSYNASPASVAAALNYLAECEGKKIFVIGDLGELGDTSQLEHERIGRLAKNLNIDLVFAFGDFSKYTLQAFYANNILATDINSTELFADKENLSNTLVRLIKKDCQEETGVTILIKGSNFMKMWEVTDKVVERYKQNCVSSGI